MGHTFSKLYFHIIFSTKGRKRSIQKDIRENLLHYIHGIAKNIDVELIETNCVIDHIHLLVKTKPSQNPSDIINKLKANSSRWIHNEYPKMNKFAWQSGFSIYSVSVSVVQNVINYIRKQEKHHKHVTFAEEYKQFLDKHGVIYDDEHYLD